MSETTERTIQLVAVVLLGWIVCSASAAVIAPPLGAAFAVYVGGVLALWIVSGLFTRFALAVLRHACPSGDEADIPD